MKSKLYETALLIGQFMYKTFSRETYFKTVLADLRGMVATKTSMVWQLDCNSPLVGSETSRPSSPRYASHKTLSGWDGLVIELNGGPIQ